MIKEMMEALEGQAVAVQDLSALFWFVTGEAGE